MSNDTDVNNAEKIKCTKLSGDGVADWCLLEATQGSLREHMKLLKDAYKEIEQMKSDFHKIAQIVDTASVEHYHMLTKGITDKYCKVKDNEQ